VEILNIWTAKPKLREWRQFTTTLKNPEQKVSIAVVGKYSGPSESYKSLNEALVHAGVSLSTQVELIFIDSEHVDIDLLKRSQGILIPGGFGTRGIEGKIDAIRFARENKIPFFGICLGMQLMCIEFARNVLRITKATSKEFDEKSNQAIIDFMMGQKANLKKGGTMRLGSFPCIITKNSKAFAAYEKILIQERHRHRLEFNNKYKSKFENAGMLFSGINPDFGLVEICEIPDHPWMVGCQFHPEFKSKPMQPHPLFRSFIESALAYDRDMMKFKLQNKAKKVATSVKQENKRRNEHA
jgi:CTP synthase